MNIDFILDGKEDDPICKCVKGAAVPRVGDIVSLGTVEADGTRLRVGKVIKVEWYFDLSDSQTEPQAAVYLDCSNY